MIRNLLLLILLGPSVQSKLVFTTLIDTAGVDPGFFLKGCMVSASLDRGGSLKQEFWEAAVDIL